MLDRLPTWLQVPLMILLAPFTKTWGPPPPPPEEPSREDPRHHRGDEKRHE